MRHRIRMDSDTDPQQCPEHWLLECLPFILVKTVSVFFFLRNLNWFLLLKFRNWLLIFCSQYYLFQESSLIQDLQPRIDAICDALNSSLDDSLLAALKEQHFILFSVDTWAVVLAIYAPMIYTAPCLMFFGPGEMASSR
jgi:hypothetical protein